MLYFIDLIDELIWGVREYLTSIKAEINKIMNIDLSKIKQIANSSLYGKTRMITDLIDIAKKGYDDLQD